ncbi:hypothetical protein ACLMJK_003946 [Lecanora helva]
MPVTPSQASDISTYYTAREPYNSLLFDTLSQNTDKKPSVHPLDAQNARKEAAAQAMRARQEEEVKGKGEEGYDGEVAEMLRRQKISSEEKGKGKA